MAYKTIENKGRKKDGSSWSRSRSKADQKTSAICRNKTIKKKVKKAKKGPLSGSDILSLLCNVKNFIGVFGSDELTNLKLRTFPCYIIVNLEKRSEKGRHWLAIRFGKYNVEIFDSLGGRPAIWGVYPKILVNFLSRYSDSHDFLFSPVIQSAFSTFCGLYCIFYVLFRQQFTFSNLVNRFSNNLIKNDLVLVQNLENKLP